MARLLFLLYQVVLVILAPLIILITAKDAKSRQGGSIYIKQRMGMAYAPMSQRPLWFHAASLGEVNTIAPLIKIIQAKQPGTAILITSNTPSGAQAAENITNTCHAYLPIDFPWAVRSFLKHYRPKHCVIVETELWPNLFSQARQQGCAPTIINGRLSAKTMRWRWLFPLFQQCLQQCDQIYARSRTDKHQFIQLGADKDRVLTVGNIKFAGDNLSTHDYPRLLDRPYLLAASTHSDEEWQFSHALAATGRLLVIIPRHPERRDEILDKLRKLPLNIAVRSLGDKVTKATQVYLADTIGEMMPFMAHADLVFMGGSLVPHGGQNMLEAARLGKAIITGPHTHNFVDEVSALKDVGGLIEVADNDELRHQVNLLTEHPERLVSMGDKALELMQNNSGIARQYYKLLQSHWK